MVESTYGTENYKFNQVDDSEFFGGQGQNPGEMHSHFGGKQKRGGVGGAKSRNFKEQKNANKRRFEKKEREQKKA